MSFLDNQRSKDAFFDSIMSQTMKLQTKSKLLKAYGPAFVCQDGNCLVCNTYRDGEAVACRSCHSRLRPKEPSQHEVCQFHKSPLCLKENDATGMDGESASDARHQPWTTEEQKQRWRENVGKMRMARDFVVGSQRPSGCRDEDWGVRKCGCVIHVARWECCSHCNAGRYKKSPYSVQWRHYVDWERVRQAEMRKKKMEGSSDATLVEIPLVYNSDYYRRIHEIWVEENKDVTNFVEAAIDYNDCDHDVLKMACSFCDRLPMPDEESFKRCGQCKVAKYCSSECQKAAWASHKTECKPVAKLENTNSAGALKQK